MKFFTAFPGYNYNEHNFPREINQLRGFLINFMNYLFTQITTKYLKKYYSPAYFNSAVVIQEMGFYKLMDRIRNDFIQAVQNQETYNDLLNLVKDTISRHQHGTSTYHQIIVAQFIKYVLPKMQLCDQYFDEYEFRKNPLFFLR